LLVEEGVNLVGHLREKGQILPSKTLGTFPRLSILVVRVARTFGGQLHMSHGSIDEKGRYANSKPALEGGELDLARSVVTVVEDGGLDASNQLLHSDHDSGPCQRHLDSAFLGSSIVRLGSQPQHDGRAFFIGDQLTLFSPKVQIIDKRYEIV